MLQSPFWLRHCLLARERVDYLQNRNFLILVPLGAASRRAFCNRNRVLRRPQLVPHPIDTYIMAPPEEATKLKDQGNNAFRNQEWDNALEFYTKAIEAYNAEPSFFTNRAQVRSRPDAHEHNLITA
jgi:hypothetical protein